MFSAACFVVKANEGKVDGPGDSWRCAARNVGRCAVDVVSEALRSVNGALKPPAVLCASNIPACSTYTAFAILLGHPVSKAPEC